MGDRDHPAADTDEDARWKWGITDSYVDGESIAIAEDDPRLDGRLFIQRDEDPYAFVDGDDVRCPETGAVHPAFIAVLAHLGLTYIDVSTSGTGAHAYYRGEFPIENERRTALQYYRSTDHAVEVFSTYFGPTIRALKRSADQEELLDDLKAVVSRYNRATDETAIVENQYLQTIATTV